MRLPDVPALLLDTRSAIAKRSGMTGLARRSSLHAIAGVAFLLAACATAPEKRAAPQTDRNVIVVVWDGLRPDTIDASLTPNLARLRDEGTEFADNHPTYPTLTRLYSGSLAARSDAG